MAEGFICFTCCIHQRRTSRRSRPRIDRSMIGDPMDFRHTGHIGSEDVGGSTSKVSGLQVQMSSKGGYDYAAPVNVQLNVIDIKTNGSS